MSDIVDLVDGLDLVVALADGGLAETDLATARRDALRARREVGHLGATLVAALIGGTGVGKSSLLNAIAGEEVSTTGSLRPHTVEPIAWVPRDAEPSLVAALHAMDVRKSVTQDRIAGLAVVDLTDVDSLRRSHRRLVEGVLPLVDLLVWVFDPLKYADPEVHGQLIAPMAGASGRMIFVVNQVDRVPDLDRPALAEHLESLLLDAGLSDPAVFLTAAAPPVGTPLGVDDLVAHLSGRLDEKRLHLSRAVEAVRDTAGRVAEAAGVAEVASLDFENRWSEACSEVIALGGPGCGPHRVEQALVVVERMVARLSVEAGRTFGARIRRECPPEWIEQGVRRALAAGGGEAIAAELQRSIGAPLRLLLWERAALAAAVAGLAVETEEAGSRLRAGRRT
ncbi:MAG: hypothetical protein QY307_10650 [Acidimicrobiia bacterium]|nr:MAG: hypothetical protein QY307_10650 [Acidimicrobiia bacterium]